MSTPSANAHSIVEWLNQRLFDGTDSSLPPDVAAELEGLMTDAFHDADYYLLTNGYFLRLPLSSALQIVAVVGPTRTPATACECRAERRARPYGRASIFRAPSFPKNQIPGRRSARDKNRTKECDRPRAVAFGSGKQ
jgi:hypothetical protein